MRGRGLTPAECAEQSGSCIPFGGWPSDERSECRQDAGATGRARWCDRPYWLEPWPRAAQILWSSPIGTTGGQSRLPYLKYIHAARASKTTAKIQRDESLIPVFLAMAHLNPIGCFCEEIRSTRNRVRNQGGLPEKKDDPMSGKRPVPSRLLCKRVSKTGVRPSTRRWDRCRCGRSRFRPPRS